MAITRRQFVTRLGALAAAVGFSQADVSKLAEAFAGNTTDLGGLAGKPRVVWVHGAECTGCSTSLLGILESAGGKPFPTDPTYNGVTTLAALGLTGANNTATLNVVTGDPLLSLWGGPTGFSANLNAIEGTDQVNIADVVIDVIDLQYHETVMGMGGDLAAKWLNEFAASTPGYFVLVVEGALQDKAQGGAWSDTSDTNVPWCSIGIEDDSTGEIEMSDMVVTLANDANCLAVVPIGQCATYGGYPGCKPPISSVTAAGFNPKMSQTGAMGVSDYLASHGGLPSAGPFGTPIVNVPGCPTNPWWFVLTVVMFMSSARDWLGEPGALDLITASGLDSGGRLKMVYPVPVHGPYCPRYNAYTQAQFALKPGDPGCLQKIGCKGLSTRSQCGVHGWNNQQPQNAGDSLCSTVAGGPKASGYFAGHCTKAGHPCMACTEKGYPDAFVPFVKA